MTMPGSHTLFLLTALILLAGTGCSLHPERAVEGPGLFPWIKCRDPRPEMCTNEYDPVCGRLVKGAFKTYGNACTACSDTGVVEHRPGSCD
jgi:hypothetical protein